MSSRPIRPKSSSLFVHLLLCFPRPIVSLPTVARATLARMTRNTALYTCRCRSVNLPLTGIVPRDVGVVIGVGGRDVEQQQLAVLALLVVIDVVQDAGIRARGDDRGVREFCLAADEFMREFSFHLGFVHSRSHELQDAAKTRGGDRNRRPEPLDFQIALHAAQQRQ